MIWSIYLALTIGLSPCAYASWDAAYTYDLDDCTSIERVGYSDQAAWDAVALQCHEFAREE